jgi:hypothetical protein
MSFDTRLFGARQTVRMMELAAARHLTDAAVLRDNGQWHGSVYLAGYSVEIYLKAAYFRYSGYSTAAEWSVIKATAETFARTRCGISRLEFHNLDHWWTMIQARRAGAFSTPWIPINTEHCVTWFNRFWRVEMRYLSLSPTLTEVNKTLEFAGQLQTDYPSLRS